VRDAPANLASLLDLLGARLEPKNPRVLPVGLEIADLVDGDEPDLVGVHRGDVAQVFAFVTADRESLIRRGIGDLLSAVDPNRFWQIHRSTIVNIDAVSGVARDFRGYLRVRLKARNETLAVNYRFAHRLRQM